MSLPAPRRSHGESKRGTATASGVIPRCVASDTMTLFNAECAVNSTPEWQVRNSDGGRNARWRGRRSPILLEWFFPVVHWEDARKAGIPRRKPSGESLNRPGNYSCIGEIADSLDRDRTRGSVTASRGCAGQGQCDRACGSLELP